MPDPVGVGVLIGLGVAGVASLARRVFRFADKDVSLPRAGGPPEDRAEAVRRVLKHLQRKTIAELEDGTAVVVVGTVKALDGVAPLVSPVTATRCLGYHVDVRLTELDEWLRLPQVAEVARCVDFAITDETGTLHVTSDGLELAITDGSITRWHPPHPPPLAAMLRPEHRFRSVTVEEGLLHAGAQILVGGVVVRERAATDYRDGAATLVLRASATFPLVASTDKDLLEPGERPIAPEELRRR